MVDIVNWRRAFACSAAADPVRQLHRHPRVQHRPAVSCVPRHGLGGNAFIYGLTGATYSIFQLMGAPLLGRWSDRVGQRRVLLLSQTGTLVSWLVFLLAFALPSVPLLTVSSAVTGSFVMTLPLVVLVLARALDGLTGGNVSVANAYLADISDDDTRAANFGKMAVSSNLGFVVGPSLAGVLGATALGAFAPVAAAALISVVATIAIAFALPESTTCVITEYPERSTMRKLLGQEQRDCFEIRSAGTLTAAVVLGRPGLLPTLSMHFLVMLSFNFFYVAFPVFAVVDLGWSLVETGTFFAVMGLLMALVQGPGLGWVTRHLTERPHRRWQCGARHGVLGLRLDDHPDDLCRGGAHGHRKRCDVAIRPVRAGASRRSDLSGRHPGLCRKPGCRGEYRGSAARRRALYDPRVECFSRVGDGDPARRDDRRGHHPRVEPGSRMHGARESGTREHEDQGAPSISNPTRRAMPG